jgi:hypothetical protein
LIVAIATTLKTKELYRLARISSRHSRTARITRSILDAELSRHIPFLENPIVAIATTLKIKELRHFTTHLAIRAPPASLFSNGRRRKTPSSAK